LAREVEVLRRCIDWLQRLEHGETVAVNLRPDTEVETERVSFDRTQVVRVLERIAAELDSISLLANDAHADNESNPHEAQARHPCRHPYIGNLWNTGGSFRGSPFRQDCSGFSPRYHVGSRVGQRNFDACLFGKSKDDL
jgi:hypothetical protein